MPDPAAGAPNPIIVAVEALEPLGVIRSIVEANPDLVRQRDDAGYLPVHRAIGRIDRIGGGSVALYLLEAWPESIRERTQDDESLLPAHLVCLHAEDRWASGVLVEAHEAVWTFVEAYPQALQEKDGKGRLPLHHAFRRWLPPLYMTRFLVETHRPALQARDDEGWVPFHYAVSGFSQTLRDIRYLAKEWRQSVFAVTNRGETPLSLAVRGSAPKNVLKFLAAKHRRSIRLVDRYGRTPLHEAARFSRVEAARFLLRKWRGAVRVASSDGRIPLHEAARGGSVELTQLLAYRYPKGVHQRDHKGMLPLHVVAGLVNSNVVRFLVGTWPESIQATTNDGWLPIHFALKYRPYDDMETQICALVVTRFLLQSYPESVWKATSHGLIPLHIAAGHGELAFTEDEDGEFEYDDYVRFRQRRAPRVALDLVEMLVDEAPTTVAKMSAEGMLPVHYAITGGISLPAVRYLFNQWQDDEGLPESAQYWSGSGQSVLHLAVSRRVSDVELVQFLVQRRPRLLRETDPRGFTPLHCAVEHNQCLHVWEYLIQRRRQYLHHRNNDGSLPLHVYLGGSGPELVKVQFLVNECPEALAETDNRGSLPLHLAVARSDGPVDIVDCLIEEHPDALDAADHAGSLPLHVAVSRRNVATQCVARHGQAPCREAATIDSSKKRQWLVASSCCGVERRATGRPVLSCLQRSQIHSTRRLWRSHPTAPTLKADVMNQEVWRTSRS